MIFKVCLPCHTCTVNQRFEEKRKTGTSRAVPAFHTFVTSV